MNNFNFTGRLAADAKIVNNGDKSFIAFTLFENRKDSKNIVKCTQTIKFTKLDITHTETLLLNLKDVRKIW